MLCIMARYLIEYIFTKIQKTQYKRVDRVKGYEWLKYFKIDNTVDLLSIHPFIHLFFKIRYHRLWIFTEWVVLRSFQNPLFGYWAWVFSIRKIVFTTSSFYSDDRRLPFLCPTRSLLNSIEHCISWEEMTARKCGEKSHRCNAITQIFVCIFVVSIRNFVFE